MKAISLHQPWASAVAFGFKKMETRHWPIGYRGHLVIHAAKKTAISECRINPYFQPVIMALEQLHLNIYGSEKLPAGALVAIAKLGDCIPTERVPRDLINEEQDSPFGVFTEGCQGNFGPGRYAWNFSRVHRIDPIPYRGHQGIFHVPEEVFSHLHLPQGIIPEKKWQR